MRRTSDKGAAFIAHGEGFVGKWYRDPVGIGTIGHGFTWASTSFRIWWNENRRGQSFGPGALMTRGEAREVLRRLLDEEYGSAVARALPNVTQHAHDGSTSVAFNGGASLLKRPWAQSLKNGSPAEAARLLRTTAVTANGKPLRGLRIRRAEEADLIERGDYTFGGPVVVADAMADGVLRRGERGPDVASLIRDLDELGFYDGRLDDIFGPGAEAALMAFQRSADLVDDGWAGPLTLAAVRQALDRRRAADPSKSSVGASRPSLSGLFTEIGAAIAAFVEFFRRRSGR